MCYVKYHSINIQYSPVILNGTWQLFIYLFFFKKCPHKYSYASNTQTPRRKIHPMCRQHEIQLPILNSVTSTDRYHNSNNTSKYILIVREPREETGMKATVLYLCDLCSTKVKISLLRYSHSSMNSQF